MYDLRRTSVALNVKRSLSRELLVPQVAPCASPSCSVCGIMGQGFMLEHAGTGPNSTRTVGLGVGNLRYGKGLYFSAISGKSNDYATASEQIRPGAYGRLRRWRCMFVCEVGPSLVCMRMRT